MGKGDSTTDGVEESEGEWLAKMPDATVSSPSSSPLLSSFFPPLFPSSPSFPLLILCFPLVHES